MTRLEKTLTAFLRGHHTAYSAKRHVLRSGRDVVEGFEIFEAPDLREIERWVREYVVAAQRDAKAKGPTARRYRVDFYIKGDTKPKSFSFSLRPKRDERISIRVPAPLKDALDREAAAQRRTAADIVVLMLEERYARRSKGGN